jgi:hypothetical protein
MTKVATRRRLRVAPGEEPQFVYIIGRTSQDFNNFELVKFRQTDLKVVAT